MDSLPVADRTCGSCMMCCKLPKIEALGKAMGVWCRFAKSGQGCTNYDDRPTQCSTFFCDWMRDASFGPEWQPSVAKFMFFTSGQIFFTTFFNIRLYFLQCIFNKEKKNVFFL